MKPNIILIIMDAATATHFSCYGYKKKTTPNIDKIVDAGYIYRKAMTNSLFTLPTHASFCTGKYPHEHKCLSFWHDRMDNTLVKKLRDSGYRTIALPSIGHGFEGGFQEYELDTIGMRNVLFEGPNLFDKLSEDCVGIKFKNNLEKYLCCILTAIKNFGLKSYLNGLYTLYKTKIKDEILLWWDDFDTANRINRIKEEFKKKSNKPLFIYMNSVEPHFPYLPHKYREEFLPNDTTRREIRETIKNSFLELTLGEKEDLSNRQKEILTALYDAEIKYLDEKIGEVYKFLKKNGYLQNTVLILTADHGEVIGKDGIYGHGAEMFDEILKIPMIIKYPDLQGEENGYVELKDLYEHILEISKGKIFPMTGKDYAFAEYYGLDTHYKNLFQKHKIDRKYWGRYQAAYYENDTKLVWDSLNRMEGNKELKDRIEALIGSPQKQYEKYRLRMAIKRIRWR